MLDSKNREAFQRRVREDESRRKISVARRIVSFFRSEDLLSKRDIERRRAKIGPLGGRGFGRDVNGTRIRVGFMHKDQARFSAENLIATSRVTAKQQTRAKRPENSGNQKPRRCLFTRSVTHLGWIIHL
jgi:hypothetical protein